ncbi:MAG: flagellar export protein FliJ [Clostridia bacterium]|nr:flagellar export protein FliJ [Clostridia bacterium]
MKKFQFHLNTVLSYKQQILDSCMNEYGAAVEQSNRQAGILEEAHERFADFNNEYREKKKAGITAIEAIKCQNCIEVLGSQIKIETEKLKKFREFEEQKRLEVVEARKETASLEKLREIKKGEYDAAALKEEEKLIDDLIASRANVNAG